MDWLLSGGARVILIWGVLNAALAGLFFGFVLAGTSGVFPAAVYAGSVALIAGLAVAAWLARYRGGQARVPARPAVAVLAAAGVALIWSGLAFGWLALFAVPVLIAAVILQIAAWRGPA